MKKETCNHPVAYVTTTKDGILHCELCHTTEFLECSEYVCEIYFDGQFVGTAKECSVRTTREFPREKTIFQFKKVKENN